jgi:hypothetical protein
MPAPKMERVSFYQGEEKQIHKALTDIFYSILAAKANPLQRRLVGWIQKQELLGHPASL